METRLRCDTTEPLGFPLTVEQTTPGELANPTATHTQADRFQNALINTKPGRRLRGSHVCAEAYVKVMFCTFYFNKDIRQTA